MNNVLERLKEISSAVMFAAEGRETEQVLERIAQISAELVHARYAALGVPNKDGGLRYFKVSGMTPEQVAKLPHLPHGKGLIGAIMQERRPIRLERMQDDSRSAGFCAQHPHMQSLLGVPIQIGQQLFGVLYLSDREDGQPFSEDDEVLIETMAGYAALAIAGTYLSDQQSRLKLLEERERIGMELHDGVIQSLYALGMHLDLIRTSEQPNSDDLKPIIAGLDQVIEDIRYYILNLKSRSYHQKTVRQYFDEILGRLHIPASVKVETDIPDTVPPFTPATFESICLIANEAISNAVRHANANVIQIGVRQTENDYRIIITDNGQGFNPNNTTHQQGLGLSNIQQRARLYGGQINIRSVANEGTTVQIIIPY
jgi:signal transduction histidine kinase